MDKQMNVKIYMYQSPDHWKYVGGLSHDEEWAPEGQYVALEAAIDRHTGVRT
jgi:hypothetical protein